MSCQRLEFIGCRDERQTSQFRYFLCHLLPVVFRSVDTGTDSRTSQRQFRQMRQCILYRLDAVFQLGSIPAELLPQSQRSRIHKMSTPDLDDRHELPAFHDEGTVQQLQRRNRILPKHLISGDVHSRRERIIRRLRFIHIVVSHQDLYLIGQFSAIQDMCTVGNHFIHIHIGLRTATSLPDHQGKRLIQAARQYLIADTYYQIALFRRQHTCILIGQRSSFFEVGKGINNLFGHTVYILYNLKVFDTTLRLRAVISIHGNPDDSHGIFFYSTFHNFFLFVFLIKPFRL